MPSLLLELEPSGIAVILSASELYEEDLRKLAMRFGTVRYLGSRAVQLDLEELLANLRELSKWPSDDVSWQPELKTLVAENIRDSQTVEKEIKTQGKNSELFSPEEIKGHLGPSWIGSLTSFQLRDISKLLILIH